MSWRARVAPLNTTSDPYGGGSADAGPVQQEDECSSVSRATSSEAEGDTPPDGRRAASDPPVELPPDLAAAVTALLAPSGSE